MSFVQIILLAFILFAIIRAVLRFKNKDIRVNEFFFWMVLWGAIAVVVIFPDLTSRLAALLGVGRGADLAIYLSTILVFYLIFRLMVSLDKIDQDVTKIVSALALKDLEGKNQK